MFTRSLFEEKPLSYFELQAYHWGKKALRASALRLILKPGDQPLTLTVQRGGESQMLIITGGRTTKYRAGSGESTSDSDWELGKKTKSTKKGARSREHYATRKLGVRSSTLSVALKSADKLHSEWTVEGVTLQEWDPKCRQITISFNFVLSFISYFIS